MSRKNGQSAVRKNRADRKLRRGLCDARAAKLHCAVGTDAQEKTALKQGEKPRGVREMLVYEMHGDRSGLVDRLAVVDKDRNSAGRTESQVVRTRLRTIRAIDQSQLRKGRRTCATACAASGWHCRESSGARTSGPLPEALPPSTGIGTDGSAFQAEGAYLYSHCPGWHAGTSRQGQILSQTHSEPSSSA